MRRWQALARGVSHKSQGYWTGPLANQFREEWNAIQPHLTEIVNPAAEGQPGDEAPP
ncbi:hypothetical protein ACWGCW_40555 [Streptomyces sp. NPDC054933]